MTDDAGRQVRRTQGVRRGVATQPSEVGGPRRQPRWWREVLLIGAWYGGYAFDTSGSYTPVWILCIVLSALAALLCFPIDDRRRAGGLEPAVESA